MVDASLPASSWQEMSLDLEHTCSWQPCLSGVQVHLWQHLTRPSAQLLWQLWILPLSGSHLCAQELGLSFRTLGVWLCCWWGRHLFEVQSVEHARTSLQVDRLISSESHLGCRSCHWISSPSYVLELLTLWRKQVATMSHISSRWCWVQASWQWASLVAPWLEYSWPICQLTSWHSPSLQSPCPSSQSAGWWTGWWSEVEGQPRCQEYGSHFYLWKLLVDSFPHWRQ